MSKIYTSADQLIGHTPLLELTHIEADQDLHGKLLAKLLQFLQILLPEGGGGIEIFNGPFVFLGDFASFRNFFHDFVPFLRI